MSELNMWAGTDAIKSQGLLPGREASGVVIGTCDGEPLIDTTLKPVVALGPCRSGKTTSIIVPSLLTWQHSAVVLDIGGELFNLTERWRRVGAHNVVRRVQFMDSASLDSYNFLEAIRHDTPHELSDIAALANTFVPDDKGDGPHIADARALLTLLMIAALSVNKSACMADVYEVLKSSDRIDEIIDAHLKFDFDTEAFQAAKEIATALAEQDDWKRATIAQIAAGALTPFACPAIAENTYRCTFRRLHANGAAASSMRLRLPLGCANSISALYQCRNSLSNSAHALFCTTSWRCRYSRDASGS